MATATATPASVPAQMTPKEIFLNYYERECATTLKVLRHFPAEQGEFRPHPRSKSARELAFNFTVEAGLASAALKNELNITGPYPAAPATMAEVIGSFEHASRALIDQVSALPDSALGTTIKFPVAKGQIGDVPVMEFLWFTLHDQIHHRGQLSVYTRMTGGTVPSIYGPSADEPWM